MNAVINNIIEITQAHYLTGYKIEFEFHDQTKKIIDFESFLTQAKNPMIKKYLNLEIFKHFTLRDGDIDWNDYELCFPIANIYDGQLGSLE